MNWEFHAVTTVSSTGLIAEYSALAAAGIEQWLSELDKGLVEFEEKQPESFYREKPKEFLAQEGPWYSFRTRVYGPGGCLDPAEYDVKVQQTFFPVFDQKIWDKYMRNGLRVRRIGKIPRIE